MSPSLDAQAISNFIDPNRQIQIPFEYSQDFIIVNAVLDNRITVRLLVDTGSEYTVIFSKFLTDLLGLEYYREIKLLGSDLSREITAHVTERVNIDLGSRAKIDRSILVLEDETVQMDKLLGVEIDGILGAEVFRNLVCHINYRQRRLELYPHSQIDRVAKKHQLAPSFIESTKPHFYSSIKVEGQTIDSLKILMDTGSAIPFMVHDDTMDDFTLPQELTSGVLGIGIGGFVQGFKGRIQEVNIGDITLNNLVTNFHRADSVFTGSYDISRNGLMGNVLLKNLDPIIDYVAKEVYFKPNFKAIERQKLDRSGLFIVAAGLKFSSFHIVHVSAGSPADEAGVKTGDIIREINGIKAKNLHIERINRRLRSKRDKTIRLQLLRGSKTILCDFTLRDII